MFYEIVGKFIDPFQVVWPKLPILFMILVFGYVAIRIILILIKDALTIARIPKGLVGIIVSLLNFLFWIILTSELAREAGLGSLAAKITGSLLVVGLALANGISMIAADIISGVFLAKDKDFNCGNRVKTGDIEGTVETMDIRKTRIRDDNGNLHVLSNSKVDSTGWVLFKKE